jgi:glycosyltransferase involved in cell wall biosynthesis
MSGSLLIYAPVPVFRSDGDLFFENQAMVGLRRWADNFDHLSVMMPVRDEATPEGWSKPDEGNLLPENMSLELLPTAYRPDHFLRSYSATRRRIEDLIDRNDYLSFSIGGLFGDWGAVGGFAAKAKNRPFAVWADRVESEVTRRNRNEGAFKRRLQARLYHKPMLMLERAVIRRADLGLFHGRETYEAYAPYSGNPHIVHDILLEKSDHLPADMLAAKIQSCVSGPLKIVFAGRADPMKGPLDWVAVLEKLDATGVDFTATWLGNGERFDDMQARITQAGLSDRVALPGFVTDRQYVLDVLRDAHIHMFCHKTPESPRNLIEALISGTPIVGYDSAYPRDLIHGNHGGELTPLNDVETLAQHMAALANDRGRLARLIENSYKDGAYFSSDAVFKHRSDLIKDHLPGPARG